MSNTQNLKEDWNCCARVWLTLEKTFLRIEQTRQPTIIESAEFKRQRCPDVFPQKGTAIVHYFVSHVPYYIHCLLAGYLYFGAYIDHLEVCKNKEIEGEAEQQLFEATFDCKNTFF